MQIKTILEKNGQIISNTHNIVGNNITYLEDDTKVSIKITTQVEITRENKDYILNLLFINKKHTNANLVLKENNYKLNLELFTNDLLITEEKIIINYTLNDEIIKFTLIKEVL